MMEDLLDSLNSIIGNIVIGRYDAIVNDGQSGALTELEIREAIQDYPGKPDMKLAEVDDLNIIYYESSQSSGIIEYELWFDGKKSDLTLSCDFDKMRNPIVIIENIHVL
jgi:hypothetical protein